VLSLNALAHGNVFERDVAVPFCGLPINAAQDTAVHYLQGIADSALRTGSLCGLDTEELNAEPDYAAEATNSRVWLDPEALSLPPDGVAGTTEFMTLLPVEIKKLYQSEASLLRDPEEQKEDPKPFLGVSPERYHDLIVRLERANLVTLQDHRPKVINGVFAVPKDGNQQRLIIDARPANAVLIPSPAVLLPNPGKLAELHLSPDLPLFVGKSDMDNFYHRLAMPRWLQQFFGLPALQIRGDRVWPVVRVLPMGWSHSVYVGQAIHETIAEKAGMDIACSFQRSSDMVIGPIRHGEYIDDYFALGSDKAKIESSLKRMLQACASVGTPAKESKVVFPSEKGETTILGVVLDSEGKAKPVREKLSALIVQTQKMVAYRTWSRKEIERLLGRWAWILLLRRPLFSVLSTVYQFLHTTSGRPTYQMRCELATLAAVAPLIEANLRRPFSGVCIATDASLRGCGVTYTQLTVEESVEMAGGEDVVAAFARRKEWHTAISHRWAYRGRIDILEGEAVLLGLKWFLRNLENRGKRVVFLVDNLALMGALKKGRSPSRRLNRICRRVAAHVVAGDLFIDYYYVRSAYNPADGPSRQV
jgi:hypothetical protein